MIGGAEKSIEKTLMDENLNKKNAFMNLVACRMRRNCRSLKDYTYRPRLCLSLPLLINVSGFEFQPMVDGFTL